ncbi:MAG: hypothetical protein VKL42_11620 [Snowella sp.]|nr:hypothetical protein [Snowella sp.]
MLADLDQAKGTKLPSQPLIHWHCFDHQTQKNRTFTNFPKNSETAIALTSRASDFTNDLRR